MRVVIDDIEYSPTADLVPLEDGAAKTALTALLTALYLHGAPFRGHNNAFWDAIRALAPGLGEALGHDPEAMLDRIDPGWRDD